jgi:hypothetical protein
MNSLERELLREKEEYFKNVILVASKVSGKKLPVLRFWENYCPDRLDGEIAHIHLDVPDGRICISKYRLRSMNNDQIRDVALHEFAHLFEQSHNSRFKNFLVKLKKDYGYYVLEHGAIDSITKKTNNLNSNNITKTEKRFLKLENDFIKILHSYPKTNLGPPKHYIEFREELEKIRWAFPNVSKESDDVKKMKKAMGVALKVYENLLFTKENISQKYLFEFDNIFLIPLRSFIINTKGIYKKGFFEKKIIDIEKKFEQKINQNSIDKTKSIEKQITQKDIQKFSVYFEIIIDNLSSEEDFLIKIVRNTEISIVDKYTTNQYGKKKIELSPGNYILELIRQDLTKTKKEFYVDENDIEQKVVFYAESFEKEQEKQLEKLRTKNIGPRRFNPNKKIHSNFIKKLFCLIGKHSFVENTEKSSVRKMELKFICEHCGKEITKKFK